MSWSSAAQRTSGRRTVCRTTCLVCAQTSLCWRPVSWTRSTVASSSGNSTRRMPACVQPLERRVDVAAHERLLHRGAQARLVGVREPDSVVLRDARDGVGRRAAFVRDRTRDLDEDDRIGLDEPAHALGVPVMRRDIHGGADQYYHEFRVGTDRAGCGRTGARTYHRSAAADGRAIDAGHHRFYADFDRSPRRSSIFCGRSRAVNRRCDSSRKRRAASAFSLAKRESVWQVGLPDVTARRNPETSWGKIDDDDEASPDRCVRLRRRGTDRRAGSSHERCPVRTSSTSATPRAFLMEVRARAPSSSTRSTCQRFLLDRGVKLVLIACNTASANALPALREASPVPVIGAVEPGAASALAATTTGHIGVIGTLGTVRSGAYAKAIAARDPHAKLAALACPLLVPLAEEGWTRRRRSPRLVARRYLAQLFAQDRADRHARARLHALSAAARRARRASRASSRAARSRSSIRRARWPRPRARRSAAAPNKRTRRRPPRLLRDRYVAARRARAAVPRRAADRLRARRSLEPGSSELRAERGPWRALLRPCDASSPR